MNKMMMLAVMIVSLVLVGCGSSGSSSSESSTSTTSDNTRFTTMVMAGDTVRRDASTKLEWVASSGVSACKPHGATTTQSADIASAEAHCNALDFAGHTDWRVATKAEHVSFVTGMHSAGLVPFYVNPSCPRLIGVDGTEATAVNTHNSNPVGALTPWTTLVTQDSSNFGVKCVRAF